MRRRIEWKVSNWLIVLGRWIEHRGYRVLDGRWLK